MACLRGKLRIMRADRLVATLLILQRKGTTTAAEIAEELEVSERTSRRDLDALSMAGVPVYSRQGRGGGWSLVGGARTDLSGLTAAEARALFLVVGPSSIASSDTKAALRKLVQALPETFRADAEAAADATRVDSSRWGRPASAEPASLSILQAAVIDGWEVMISYAKPGTAASTRTVGPLGLVVKRGTWYLLGSTDKGLRTFRVDRVQSAEPTGRAVVRPTDFDLDAAWGQIQGEVAERFGSLAVQLLADPEWVRYLWVSFPRGLQVVGTTPSGRIEIEVNLSSVAEAAGRLGGFGAAITVVHPPELIVELRRIGEELVAQYASGGTPGIP